MRYVGMHTQIMRNNRLTIMLLILFPVIILGMVWVFLALVNYFGNGYYDQYGNIVHQLDATTVNYYFMNTIPWVIVGVGIWFTIAYFANTAMVRAATGARPLTRKENPKIYNIVENLCMTCNMDMPKINIVDDPQLNAFASGIDKKSYTVTLTTGIIDRLNDDELAGVIAHELTHIRNHDTRLLITSIIFVGIVSTIMSLVIQMMYNAFWFGGLSSRSSDDEDNRGNGLSMIAVFIIGALCCAVAYFFTLLTRLQYRANVNIWPTPEVLSFAAILWRLLLL